MPRIDDFKNALDLAREAFKEKDPRQIAEKSGAAFETDPSGAFFRLPFLDRELSVTWPEGKIVVPEGSRELSLQEQGLILHYLVQAGGTPLTGKWITFREIPSGEFYYSAFVKRAKDPLVAAFGSHPRRLIEVGVRLGGKERKEGDASVFFQVLPRIPLCLILWAGDEEFPPDGNILFDANISDYLSAEDAAVLSGMVIYPLIGMART
jgi:hypothetical protein